MAVIGYGALVLAEANDALVSGAVRFIIKNNNIEFYGLSSDGSSQELTDVLANLSGQELANKGHLSLLSLPASPQAAFYGPKLTAVEDGFQLTVEHADKFAGRGLSYFKDLKLTFTTPKTAEGLVVNGSAFLCLFGRADLAIKLEISSPDASQHLVFTPVVKTLNIKGLGSLEIEGLQLVANEMLWDKLEALYTFSEFSGTTANVLWNSAGLFLQSDRPRQSAQLLTKGNANQIQSVVGGISLNGGSDIHGRSHLESVQAGKAIAEKCKISNAITISAWVKPAQELTDSSNTPKRIVSLSKNTGERNFTLGQDIDPKPDASGKYRNRYSVRLRRGSGNKNGIPPLVSKPTALKVGDLAHIVFTRGDETSETKTGRIYINGQDETALQAQDLATLNLNGAATELTGNFEHWEFDHSLLLGNEKGGELKSSDDRSWVGEIYQVAIYSRGLSNSEIKFSYVPDIRMQATLALENVPAPFHQTLPITINFDANQLTVDQSETLLAVVPSLILHKVDFSWQQQEAELQFLSGNATGTLWGNAVSFNLNLTAEEFKITKPDAAKTTLVLNDVEPFLPLGNIELTQLNLRADRSPTADWTFDTDGQVNFAAIPPPLKGPFPIALYFDQGKLWFTVVPGVPLRLIEELYFDQINLRFARSDSGWQVEPDHQQTRDGIHLSLFGQTRKLTPQLVPEENAKALKLSWSTEAVDQQLGRLNIARFSLTSEPDASPTFWHVVIKGNIPLGLSQLDGQANTLDFETLTLTTFNGELMGNPERLDQPLTLKATGSLESQTATLVRGDLQLQGNRFYLAGQLKLFPDWSTTQVMASPQVQIAIQDGQVSFAAVTAQVILPGSFLGHPELELSDGRLRLKGYWLGQPEPQVFFVRERSRGVFLQGFTEAWLPFSLNLPPLMDDITGAELAPAVEISGQQMHLQLDTEFQAAGFSSVVNANFNYLTPSYDKDIQEAVEQTIILPERRLYEPPANLSVLLGDSLAQFQQLASELFGTQGNHSRGYTVVLGNTQPQIFFSQNHSREAELTCEMPALFASNSVSLNSADGLFTLQQADGICTLTLKPTGHDPTRIKEIYDSFLKEQVAAQALLSAGAMSLLKRRIAERLPLNYSDLLYYYYGWDVAQGYIDLQAGMRLRVDLQNYQFVHPSEPMARSGFVGSGSCYIPVNSYTFPQGESHAQLLGFGPFLSRLQVNGSVDITNRGAGSVFDLLREGYRKPYYRLFFPQQPSRGDSSERAVMLVGADTLPEMAEATDAVVSSGGSPPTAGTSFFFRGKAVILPEIQVYAGNKPLYVPVGTTLRQLIEMYDDIPAAGLPSQDLRSFIGSSRPLRLVHEGVNSTPSYRFINFQDADAVGHMDVLDLPLVKGDRVCL